MNQIFTGVEDEIISAELIFFRGLQYFSGGGEIYLMWLTFFLNVEVTSGGLEFSRQIHFFGGGGGVEPFHGNWSFYRVVEPFSCVEIISCQLGFFLGKGRGESFSWGKDYFRWVELIVSVIEIFQGGGGNHFLE